LAACPDIWDKLHKLLNDIKPYAYPDISGHWGKVEEITHISPYRKCMVFCQG